MPQAHLFPCQDMGCGGSKTVATISSGSSVNVKAKNTRKHSTSKCENNEFNVAGNSREQTDIAVFNDTDNSTDHLENARPILPRSGFRRIDKPNEGPIVPCIEPQTDIPPSSDRLDSTSTFESENGSYRTSRKNSSCSVRKESTATEKVHDNNQLTNGHHDPPQDNKDEQLTLNPFKLNLSESRASSVQAGSILTTTGLNASFMTSFDAEDRHSEIAFGSFVADSSEFDDSTFRTLSNTPNTPSVDKSVLTTPAYLQDKICGPIMEEFEGGFTPRSIITNGDTDIYSDRTQKFSYRDVIEHNRKVGWKEWGIYRNNVYDNKRLKEIFNPLLKAVQEEEAAKQLALKKEQDEQNLLGQRDNGFIDSDDSLNDSASEYSDDCCNFAHEITLEDISRWNNSGVRLLLVNNMDKTTLESRLRSCCIGSLYQEHETGYWEDLRKDVKILLDDLIRADSTDDLSVYMGEYMRLLQRWVQKYRSFIPQKTIVAQGDPNQFTFPLPEEIMQNPECFRQWLETWETFDFEIPEEGVWPVIEDEIIDLGDPHEIFSATLKSHINLTPLDTEIKGEAGWSVIQEGLVADDVMTDSQRIIEKQRANRTDLFDPKRMKKRRERLLKYFERKYEMDPSKIHSFSNWAVEMEKGEREFLKLCENS